MNALALVAVRDLIPNPFKKDREAIIRIMGVLLFVIWLLIIFFIMYKMAVNFSLPKKIQKLSQKLAQIDKEIAEELSKL